MPTLIFTNGTRKDVDYDKAIQIKQILDCEVKPENKEQANFVSNIAHIKFEPIATPNRNKRTVEHDTEMDTILTNTALKGRAKLKAVVDRIRARRR